MIAGRGVLTAIVRMQVTATVSASGDALQQSTAFSHSASGLMRFGMNIAVDARLVSFKRRPVDEARVMAGHQHHPFLHRQAADSLSHNALFIDISF